MSQSRTLMGVAGLLAVVALATPGCATKKYVRQNVDPVNQRVNEIDKKHAEAVAQLADKESKDVSRVEERAMGAETRANEANRAAQQAAQRAEQVGQVAQSAQQLAQQTQTKLGDVEKMVGNIDNYKLASSETLLFGFDRATLTNDAKAKLDALVQNATDKNRVVIEVQGFTDRIGPRDYNLALSRRRADAVVRYLVSKNVPLRRIHMIGLGTETPPSEMSGDASGAGTQTTEVGTTTEAGTTETTQGATGRPSSKELRRVIVRIYVPETMMAASTTTGMSGQTSSSSDAGMTTGGQTGATTGTDQGSGMNQPSSTGTAGNAAGTSTGSTEKEPQPPVK